VTSSVFWIVIRSGPKLFMTGQLPNLLRIDGSAAAELHAEVGTGWRVTEGPVFADAVLAALRIAGDAPTTNTEAATTDMTDLAAGDVTGRSAINAVPTGTVTGPG